MQWTPTTAWLVGGSLLVAAAAVVVAVGFTTGIFGHTPSSPAGNVAVNSTSVGGAPDLTFGASGATPGASASPQTARGTVTPSAAPAYLLFQRRVYRPGSLVSTSAAQPQQIGTAVTAFDTSNAPTQVNVYRSPVADGSIVVQGPSGLQVFTPVTRTYDGQVFQLVSGVAIPNFGLWPKLPLEYPVPTAADGSPTFAKAGQDSLDVPIYTPGGTSVTDGFAIAPNTPNSDPAAANPNWTWWEPLVTP